MSQRPVNPLFIHDLAIQESYQSPTFFPTSTGIFKTQPCREMIDLFIHGIVTEVSLLQEPCGSQASTFILNHEYTFWGA